MNAESNAPIAVERDGATDKINAEVIRLLDRQRGVIDQLQELRDRLYGETPQTAEKAQGQDVEAGRIGAIKANLAEAHAGMTCIKNLINELSEL